MVACQLLNGIENLVPLKCIILVYCYDKCLLDSDQNVLILKVLFHSVIYTRLMKGRAVG